MSFQTVTDPDQIVNYLQFSATATLITAAAGKHRTVSTNSSVLLLPTYPFRLAVGVIGESYTHELIRESGEFVVHAAGEGMQRILVQCGTLTGRNMDKFELTHLATGPASQVEAPLILECPVAAECRLEAAYEFDRSSLLVSKVLAVHVAEALLDTGRQPNPLIYNPKGIYQLGEQVIRGTSWLSPLLRALHSPDHPSDP